MSVSPFELVLPATMTLASVKAIWAEWQSSPASKAVNVADLEQVDIAGLQLLVALRPIELTGSSPALDAAMTRAGLSQADFVKAPNPEMGL